MLTNLRSVFVLLVAVTVAVTITTLPIRAADDSKALLDRVKKLEKKVAKLEAKLAYVTVVEDPINGLSGPHIVFTGCNVHVRSGSGATSDTKTPLGLGNLIVGYNEEPMVAGAGRGGSHNLIVGPYHNYSDVGGVVFGESNTASGPFATVTGGYLGTASGSDSSVSGGTNNQAIGEYASVSGGVYNNAHGESSSVSGGSGCDAWGDYSSVSGGLVREVYGESNWRGGAYFSTE